MWGRQWKKEEKRKVEWERKREGGEGKEEGERKREREWGKGRSIISVVKLCLDTVD